MVRLDTRPARRLTSREISSIICAALAPPLMAGHKAEVLVVLQILADPAARAAATVTAQSMTTPDLRAAACTWKAVVAAVVAGCARNQAVPTDIAVRWTIEHLDELAANLTPEPAAARGQA